jgi:hypothetical protein
VIREIEGYELLSVEYRGLTIVYLSCIEVTRMRLAMTEWLKLECEAK